MTRWYNAGELVIRLIFVCHPRWWDCVFSDRAGQMYPGDYVVFHVSSTP